jgi:putative ABC transport system permease protein
VVTALGTSTSNQIGGEIDSFAANGLFVWPQPVQASGARSKVVGRLTEADGRAIAREAVSVSGVAPFLQTQGQVVYGDKNVQTALIGTTLPYFPIRRFAIGKGSLWTESDELVKTKVCVIGETVATGLFGNEDPVGRTVRIGRSPYRIVGVLEARGSSPFGDDQDDRVLLPIGSFRARVMHTSPGRADQLIVGATSPQTVNRAKEQIESILRQRHRLEPGRDDFQVSSQAEMRETQEAITSTLGALLLGVAAISLVVGGVGVMNIMLVSVAERTREIGIRKALGARKFDILVQFLIEAAALTGIGGIIGIMFGWAISMVARLVFSSLPATVPGWAAATGIVVSVGVGLFFGIWPANKAARLDPVVALRYE